MLTINTITCKTCNKNCNPQHYNYIILITISYMSFLSTISKPSEESTLDIRCLFFSLGLYTILTMAPPILENTLYAELLQVAAGCTSREE